MTSLRTMLLFAGLTALLALVGQALGGAQGLLLGLALALVMHDVGYWHSDRIALRMAGAREVTPREAPGLHGLLTELAIYAGLPTPRLYIIDEPSPNAFATGRDPRHAAVAVTRGLLRLLDEREVTGVLAHELAHIKNRDTLLATMAAVLAGAIAAVAERAQWALLLGDPERQEDERWSPLAALPVILVAPLAALALQFAISRQREFAADQLGARIAGDPLPLADALRKLAAGVAAVPPRRGNPALASLAIVNPFAGDALLSLFSAHPPVSERIERLWRLRYGPSASRLALGLWG